MKVVLAVSGSSHLLDVVTSERYPHILTSFMYPKVLADFPYVPDYFILDSGAFTAWNTGKTVNRAELCAYAIAAQKRIPNSIIVNLDVIPGRPGRPGTPDEKQRGMAESLKNADYMRSLGLNVMEVYHQDEPFAFLDLLIQRMPVGGILGISPRNDVKVHARRRWLSGVLTHILKRHPKTAFPRTHGLGVMSVDLMSAFPFYSVDATSWAVPSMYGKYIGATGTQLDIVDVLPSSRVPLAHQWGSRVSIKNMRRWEQDVTTLWEKRGVRWKP